MNSLSKKMICFLAVTLFSFCFVTKVEAKVVPNVNYVSSSITLDNGISRNVMLADRCDSLLGDPSDEGDPAYWLQLIFNAMKYFAIIALFALVTLDFFKALVADDKDAIKKAGQKAAKRLIYCVLVFFLPIIVEFLMTMMGLYGTCGIG